MHRAAAAAWAIPELSINIRMAIPVLSNYCSTASRRRSNNNLGEHCALDKNKSLNAMLFIDKVGRKLVYILYTCVC